MPRPENIALIVGNGGREHALALAIRDNVDLVYSSPGNSGTVFVGRNFDVAEKNLVDFARYNATFTIIGPEGPLAAGVTDQFRAQGLEVVGPSGSAARLEASKSFACDFMEAHGIPYPKTQILRSKSEADAFKIPLDVSKIIIKADGLAGGKGVVLPKNGRHARMVINGMISGEQFDGAGKDAVLIQERLSGPEVSAHIITDGKRMLMLPFTQDHKRLNNNDEGPNTGGMGAYTPLPETILSKSQQQRMSEIAETTIKGMARNKTSFQGILYIGFMLAEQYDGEPVVIEYNARFGDPEAEVLLPMLQMAGIDSAELLRSTNNTLSIRSIPEKALIGKAALTTCLATQGYPDSLARTTEVFGLGRSYEGVIVHHGSTKKQGESRVMTAGGRAMYITGIGETVTEAAQKSLAAIGPNGIHFEGMQYRHDIGWQARTDI